MLKVTNTENGGDLTLTGNRLTQTDSVSNQIYLAMYSGSGDYWANDLFPVIKSYTEAALLENVLNTNGRLLIEEAIKKDLQFLDGQYTLTTKIVNANRIDILIVVNGQLYSFYWQPVGGLVVVYPNTHPFSVVLENDDSVPHTIRLGILYFGHTDYTIAANTTRVIYSGLVLATFGGTTYIENTSGIAYTLEGVYSSNGTSFIRFAGPVVFNPTDYDNGTITAQTSGVNNIIKFTITA